MAAGLLLLLVALAFAQQIDPECLPAWSKDSPKPSGFGVNKIIYYSPSVIGEDPHVGKIDVYTSYFHNLHKRDLPLIKQLGATHILVSENWAADGSYAHQNFLRLCNETGLKLIVTYAIPTGEEEMSATDFKVIRDRAKQAFLKLLEEFTDPVWRDLLEAYNIPAPPADKLSTKEVGMYYEMVNVLIALQDCPKHGIFVGYPINSQTSKSATFEYKSVFASAWTMNIYTSDLNILKGVFRDWSKATSTSPIKPAIPIINVDSFSQLKQEQNNTKQVLTLIDMYNRLKVDFTSYAIWGNMFMEFSDEWWRADLSTGGYNVEGCPNGNAYAHTSCGITIPSGDILSLEYQGLYEILDTPFQFCIVKKPAVDTLHSLWVPNPAERKNFTAQECAMINMIIPPYAIGALGGLALICLVVILIIPPPAPPKKKYTELLQMSAHGHQR